MPTKREREYYRMGFQDGKRSGSRFDSGIAEQMMGEREWFLESLEKPKRRRRPQKPKKKRTLTAWQKFVKTNSKKKEFRLRGGKVNLKKLGVAYRKKTGKRKGKK